MNVLVGGAWPYANGSLHIGHIAALLPGDVIARFHRLRGDSVYYVSGSDCHGTPVAIRAKQEGKSPQQISDHYHEEFRTIFDKLGFSYDLYGKTSSEEHKRFVIDFHKKMYDGDYIYEKVSPQAYCRICRTNLADRFITGTCPVCGQFARGDQCDACGTVPEPETLIDPHCETCGGRPIFNEGKHLYIAISKLREELERYLSKHPLWRKNAIAFTRRYIEEGLRDRAVTRSLDWGIDVPMEGYEDKKIYIWAENVLGYLSMSNLVALQKGDDFYDLWGDESKHYYVHGKDNIPFHTIILPSLLLAHGGSLHLPDEIISSEYLTLEGRRISTSHHWAIWVKDIVDRYDPDSLRYYLMAKGPEKRDSDFTWQEYVNSHNGELLGAYGNFINRTLAFVHKYYNSVAPNGTHKPEIQNRIESLYRSAQRKLEKGACKDTLEEIFEFVRFGNRYFDAEEPWKTRNSDPDLCGNTLFNCVQMIMNQSILLEPFLPFSSRKLQRWLGFENRWEAQYVKEGYHLPRTDILFERLDKAVIKEELQKLTD